MYWIHFLILSGHTYLLLPHKCAPRSHLRLLSQLNTGRALFVAGIHVLYHMLPNTVTNSEFQREGMEALEHIKGPMVQTSSKYATSRRLQYILYLYISLGTVYI